MFISDAYANDSFAIYLANSPIGGLIPLFFVFAVFFFLIIKPQQNKLRQHKEMIDALKVGDRVETSAGLLGKISKINLDSDTIFINIAKDLSIEIKKESVLQKISDKREAAIKNNQRDGSAEAQKEIDGKTNNNDQPKKSIKEAKKLKK